jgi:hypothetical protein
MAKETTSENICQKRPLLSGGTPWPGDTWHVPPGPMPARPCRRSQFRHVAVATSLVDATSRCGACRQWGWRHVHVARACRQWGWRHVHVARACRQWGWRHVHVARGAGNGGGGMPATSPLGQRHGHVPGLATAARWCRHWPRRHVPRVAWPGGAATQKGSFLANIFRGDLFYHFIGAGGLFCQKFRGARGREIYHQSLPSPVLVVTPPPKAPAPPSPKTPGRSRPVPPKP